MISVEQASQIISENIQLTDKSIDVNLIDAIGYVLFQDVLSPINMPPFRQSAMDGYAINLHDAKTYALIGEIKAGDAHQLHLKPGDAVRIFTGAPVPGSANAVVMQERTSTQNKTLIIDSDVLINENIKDGLFGIHPLKVFFTCTILSVKFTVDETHTNIFYACILNQVQTSIVILR